MTVGLCVVFTLMYGAVSLQKYLDERFGTE